MNLLLSLLVLALFVLPPVLVLTVWSILRARWIRPNRYYDTSDASSRPSSRLQTLLSSWKAPQQPDNRRRFNDLFEVYGAYPILRFPVHPTTRPQMPEMPVPENATTGQQ